jgi:hypothetical protein
VLHIGTPALALASIHPSAWKVHSRKFRQKESRGTLPRPFSLESLPQGYGAGLPFTTVRM